jgi:ribulose-phosphate 3-epimerase
MIEIAPSILAANVLNLGQDIQMVLHAGAAALHVDIMDAHFVPNLTFGPHLVQALRRAFPTALLDVHLMMTNPEEYIEAFAQAGADELTIHVEIEADVGRVLADIRALGVKPGLSLRPGTPASALDRYLGDIDQVLVMSVEPGFGGQKIQLEQLSKLSHVRDQGFHGVRSVDGGIVQENAYLAVSAGATRLVMGSGIYGSDNPAQVIDACRKLLP